MKKRSCLTKLTGSRSHIYEFKCEYVRLVIVSVILFIAPLLFGIEICASNMHYVLSSIVQGFAALFALAVTIPMYFAQSFSEKRYVKMWIDSQLRPLQLLFYFVLVVTIVLPLFLLAWNNFTPFLVKMSLSLALVSIYGTIESVYACRRRFMIIWKIHKKQEKCNLKYCRFTLLLTSHLPR